MNRYTVAGVLADMRVGRRLIVVSDDLDTADDAYWAVHANLHPSEISRRTRGSQCCQSPTGGRILFRSQRSGFRGMTADVVVLDVVPTPVLLAEIAPVVAATQGEVIRA